MKYQAKSGILQILQDPEIQPLLKRTDDAYLEFANAVNSGGKALSTADNALDSLEILIKSIGKRNPLLANLMVGAAFIAAGVSQVRLKVPSKVIVWRSCTAERNLDETKEATDKKEVWE